MDELAQSAGKDPLEFRRALMAQHPKHLAVLNAVADRAGWGKPAPAGVYRGLAQMKSFGSFVAACAEIKVTYDSMRIRQMLLMGATPAAPKLINTCYSLVAPDYGISIAGVYQPSSAGLLADVPGSGGVSPLEAPRSMRAAEATLADAWFRTHERGLRVRRAAATIARARPDRS